MCFIEVSVIEISSIEVIASRNAICRFTTYTASGVEFMPIHPSVFQMPLGLSLFMVDCERFHF